MPRQIQPAKKVCEGGILPTNYDLIVIFLQNQSRRKTCGSGGWVYRTGLSVALCWDCTLAPSKAGPPALEHRGTAAHTAWESFGRPATGPRNASWPLPGDGLSHPEHGGPGRIPTGDRNGSGGSPLAGWLIHDRLGHHLMNGGGQPGEDAGCKIARMMIRSKNIGEIPMDGAVHIVSPHSYSVPKAGEKPWKNNPNAPPAYKEMEGKGKI